MDKRSLDGKQSSKEVTEIISRNIRAGHERDYDDWLRRFMISERQFPGYLGTTIIAPGGNVSSVRYIINRFANQASLDAWENSQESLKLLKEVNKYSTYHRLTGMETWFSLPAQYILRLYLGQLPLLTNILMTIILVLGLTYFAMPLLSRLLRRWLYPRNV